MTALSVAALLAGWLLACGSMRWFDNATMSNRNRLLAALCALACGLTLAQAVPPEVASALLRAKLPLEAVSLLVVDADAKTAPRLSHRAAEPMNPASVMKLVTTYAALDLLGPAYRWHTPVFVQGVVRAGTLHGNLHIQGQGDPTLVAERLWLLLRRVQGLGIQKIAGDIVLDASAFEAVAADPASFDGEPLRPYNAAAAALLLNFKSVLMTFVPDPGANIAHVQFEPPLFGVQMQASVALATGACGDYRAALKADFADPTRIRFDGSYAQGCGEKVWPVAYTDPASYNARAVQGLWRAMGGELSGRVREGPTPALAPVFELASPSLAEVIRDINKYSNNVMAQQVFLTLSLPTERAPASAARGASSVALDAVVARSGQVATRAASRDILQRWWQQRFASGTVAPLIDNGSGLSRTDRISAQALARLLQGAYQSPLMPELMASLPLVGVDGTLKRSKAQASGRAHLKSGSLRDVSALAGYVHANSGKRYVLVAIANHTNASAARPAFDALLDWAVRDN